MDQKKLQTISSALRDYCDLATKGKDKQYWHYTSLNAMISIFNKFIKREDSESDYVKECAIWASNVRFMNDPLEFREGKRVWEKYCENNKIHCSESCNNDRYSLISFSTDGDNLGQWKWYGKKSGVSFCLNTDKLETSTIKNSDVYDSYQRPISVFYTSDDKESYFNMLRTIRSQRGFDWDMSELFIPYCKDENYIDEKEARMVFFELDEDSDIVYNTGENGRVKPALNVRMRLRTKKEVGYEYIEELLDPRIAADDTDNIVTEIVVGPGNNQELVFNALIHIFDRKHFHYIEIDNEEDISPAIPVNELKEGEYKKIKIKDKESFGGDIKTRYGYKCHNGIIIWKSSIPFRG